MLHEVGSRFARRLGWLHGFRRYSFARCDWKVPNLVRAFCSISDLTLISLKSDQASSLAPLALLMHQRTRALKVERGKPSPSRSIFRLSREFLELHLHTCGEWWRGTARCGRRGWGVPLSELFINMAIFCACRSCARSFSCRCCSAISSRNSVSISVESLVVAIAPFSLYVAYNESTRCSR